MMPRRTWRLARHAVGLGAAVPVTLAVAVAMPVAVFMAGLGGRGWGAYLAVPAGTDLLIKHVTTAEDRSRQGHQRWLSGPRDFSHLTVLA